MKIKVVVAEVAAAFVGVKQDGVAGLQKYDHQGALNQLFWN